MKILLLSFYFRPDLCAGSFRAAALTEALLATLPSGSSIDVITTHPNRYDSFIVKASDSESAPGLDITRIALPAHRNGMADQTRAFMVFAWQAWRHIRGKDYDLVFATSSRLMTATLGALFARSKGVPLYLDIRDIFVDTIKDVLHGPVAFCARQIFSLFEQFTMRSAKRINLVSEGFYPYFQSRYPSLTLSCFTNGIDDEFLTADVPVIVSSQKSATVEILYAGNIGDGQGLDIILPALAWHLRGQAHFRIIGDGSRKAALVSALNAAGVDNVILLPPINRQELICAYEKADVLFMHLNNYNAFKKVLPSKVFEYGATGKPVLAGIDGFAAGFVHRELDNAAIFAPCDAQAGVNAFKSLRLIQTDRTRFIQRYTRRNIMSAMAQDVIEIINEK